MIFFATIKNSVKLLIIFRHLQTVFQEPVTKKNREAFVLQLSLKTNILKNKKGRFPSAKYTAHVSIVRLSVLHLSE